MRHITVHALKEVLTAKSGNADVDFINVCTPAEYNEKHIPGVRNVPLDELDKHISELNDKNTIYIHCRSGKRGLQAIEKLTALGVTAELVNVEGGILAWDEAGYGTRSLTARMPLMQQVLLTAGLLSTLGFVLGWLVHPNFVYLSLFVGLGLAYAGASGHCTLAYILSKMPWNK